ncbi:unnamed protein product [Linum tenue]|uniref:Protein CHUP1, chloroplastic n=1 Tax=Linum tenue TaxID=586396 RepID=A0AAV0Q589_9ROSI|nr:unnamed protein product [Linum tenue]
MGDRDRKDIRPLLLRFGVVVSVSFAGFLASRVAANRIHMAKQQQQQPPRSPRSPDHESSSKADVGASKAFCDDDIPSVKRSPGSGCMGLDGQNVVCRVKAAGETSTGNFSPSCKLSGDKDGYLLPEFNDLINDFGVPKQLRSVEEDEKEIRHLKNKVKTLEERERKLEAQLVELYGLKEHETAVTELQNRVKINNMETKLLTLKMESLQAENQKLVAQASEHTKIASELDAARAKIKLLKKKLRSETEQNKEQILALKKKVSKLQEQEIGAASSDSEQRLKDLEVQTEELTKSNMKLKQENSDLAHRLEATQVLANSVLEDPAVMEELRQLSNRLSEENIHLKKEVERLKADRCSDVEELVYLRWINACLRYELRNFQAPNGKTAARDLSKSLSPESEEKAKKLILQYANPEGMGEKGMRMVDFETDQWISSQASYITDSTHFDDTSSVSTKATSISNHSPRKLKIFKKLRRLIRGKDAHSKDEHRMEDSDYPSSVSTGTDAGSDTQSNRGLTPLISYRYSTDSQRMSIPGLYDAKDVESLRATSDLGSTDLLRRFSSGPETSRDFLPENDDLGKSDLVRFAGVLKDSNGNNVTELQHRKGKSSIF